MSDIALNYLPEEHAPDPVISHGDPTPPGKVAIWLFLASEVMFFIGILGSYIVLRSGWPMLFEQSGRSLNKLLAGINTLVLIFSSLTMALAVDAAAKGNRKRLAACLGITLACAFGFMGIKYVEYSDKFHHYTVVESVKEKGADGSEKVVAQYVYDGHYDPATRHMKGVRVPLTDNNFNINFAGREWVEQQIRAQGLVGSGEKITEREYHLKGTIAQQVNYGPWKNLFYSSYFAATGVHGLHVIGGIIPLGILCIQALRGRILPAATEYVGLYWHFVDLVWIFLFPLMYLI